MIGPDDIDAFIDENAGAMRAAEEYRRRWEKGIPSDRWTDGALGAEAVAKGIAAMEALLRFQARTLLDMAEQIEAARRDATELHARRH